LLSIKIFENWMEQKNNFLKNFNIYPTRFYVQKNLYYNTTPLQKFFRQLQNVKKWKFMLKTFNSFFISYKKFSRCKMRGKIKFFIRSEIFLLIFLMLEGKYFVWKKARTSEMRRKKLSNDYNAVNHSQMIDERRKKARKGRKKIQSQFSFQSLRELKLSTC
jgi:hypothetical protein